LSGKQAKARMLVLESKESMLSAGSVMNQIQVALLTTKTM